MRISFIVYVVLYKYQTSSSNSIGLLATLRGSTLVIVCVYINAIADAATTPEQVAQAIAAKNAALALINNQEHNKF